MAYGAECRFGMDSSSDRGRGGLRTGERSGGGCAEGGGGTEVRWSESCALWRRCAASELQPTLIADAVEIRMPPAAEVATRGAAPCARRACSFLAAEMAVPMRARALGERGT